MIIRFNKKIVICLSLFMALAQASVENDYAVSFAVSPAVSQKSFIQNIFPASTVSNSIITQIEWSELEYDLVVQKLDRTITAAGFIGLKKLAEPIADKAQLMQRQNSIKKLVSDYNLYAQIKNHLQKISQTENDLFAYWDPHDSLCSGINSLRYAIFDPVTKQIDRSLNHSKAALEFSVLYEGGKTVLGLAAVLGVVGLWNQVTASIIENESFNPRQALKEGIMRPVTVHSTTPSVFKDGYAPGKWPQLAAGGTLGDYYIFSRDKWELNKFFAGACALTFVATQDLFFLTHMRDSYQRIKYLYQVLYGQQHRLVNVAQFFQTVEDLKELMQESELFDQQTIDKLDISKKSDALQKLAQLLKTNTFKQPKKYFFSRGNVLAADQLIFDVKDELLSLLETVAQIDAYYSIATIYQEYANSATPFSFAQYSSQADAAVYLDAFWTPLVNLKEPVVNSLTMDAVKKNKIIITGPSGAGKSVLMKAVAHVILLAQSWTIAPAKAASISVYTCLRTSLLPRENSQLDISTFMAGVKRAQELIKIADTLPENSRCFLLFDEPFNGIVEAESAKRVNILATHLQAKNNCAVMMALHIFQPTELEKTTHAYNNYQVLTDPNNNDCPTYKFDRGVATWWFFDQKRRERYVDALGKKIALAHG